MLTNHAFIDSQNLNLGMRDLGWKLDYRKFRVYLRERYKVNRAFVFLGFIPSNKELYHNLENAGFELVFKPIILNTNEKIKGNIDADLVLKAMIEFDHYERAIIVTSDGDFYSLVLYLDKKNKLEGVLSPDKENCSSLLKQAAKGRIDFMYYLRNKLEYK